MAQPQPTTYTTVYTSNIAAPQPAPYTVVSQPVEITTVQQQTTFSDQDREACKKNGGFQILMGLLCMVFGTVSICIHTYFGDVATPFWTGCWFIIAGSCGTRVAYYQGYMAEKSLQRFMSLSGVAIVFAITLLIMMSIAIANEYEYSYGYSYASRVGIDATLLTISVLELLAAFKGMGIAQKTVRGAQRNTTTTTRSAVATGVAPVTTGYPPVPVANPYPPAYGPSQGFQQPPPQYGYPPQQAAPPAQAGYGSMDGKPPAY